MNVRDYVAIHAEAVRIYEACERDHVVDDDDEAAHAREDELRAYVLGHIANGTLTVSQAKELAELSLRTEGLDFARWRA